MKIDHVGYRSRKRFTPSDPKEVAASVQAAPELHFVQQMRPRKRGVAAAVVTHIDDHMRWCMLFHKGPELLRRSAEEPPLIMFDSTRDLAGAVNATSVLLASRSNAAGAQILRSRTLGVSRFRMRLTAANPTTRQISQGDTGAHPASISSARASTTAATATISVA